MAYGIRQKRKENVLKRSAYFAFYRLLRAVSAIEIPLDAGDFSCMRRRVVDAMLESARAETVRPGHPVLGRIHPGRRRVRTGRAVCRGLRSTRCASCCALAYDGLFSFTQAADPADAVLRLRPVGVVDR